MSQRWKLAWDLYPPQRGDPDYAAYLAAQEGERERIKSLVASAEQAPPLTAMASDDGSGVPLDEQRKLARRMVDGTASELSAYLGDVEAFLCRYVVWPDDHGPRTVALWVAHAHLVDLFEVSPILAITSAEMRSGKTRLLDCLELLCPNAHRAVIPSEAVVYTVLAQRPRPTFLLDEADAVFGRKTAERYEGLRAVLNSGNRQGTPVLRVRLEGRNREVESLDVFGPKAIAGIGRLPATVADRSISIRLRRRAPDEHVARFRTRQARAAARAIDQPDWSRFRDLRADGTPVPDDLNDRAADGWESLLAIADEAGGTWPVAARDAAIAISSDEDAPVSIGIRLLADIREAFGREAHLPTADLLQRLYAMDSAPWADWYGSALSARGLARLLEPYGIGPRKRRVGGDQHRGYFASDFSDAWRRYVPSAAPVPTAPSVPGGTDGTDGTASPDGAYDPEYARDDDAEGFVR